MSLPRSWRRLSPLFLGIVLACCARTGAAADARPAPAFSLKTRSGGVVASDSLRGKVVLVDFWASWCAPCQRSFPWMGEIAQRYAPRGLVVVAINLDRDRDLADDFLAHHPATFAIAYDPGGKVADAFHVKGMPSTFLIDRDGKLLHDHIGFDTRKAGQLEALIQEACAR